jgi:hypothetical protein
MEGREYISPLHSCSILFHEADCVTRCYIIYAPQLQAMRGHNIHKTINNPHNGSICALDT